MPRRDARLIGYILLSADGLHYWAGRSPQGKGLLLPLPSRGGALPCDLPQWVDFAAARHEAGLLALTYGVQLKPCPFRLP